MESYKALEELRIRDYEKKHGHPPNLRLFPHEFKVKKPKTASNLEALCEELVNRMGGKVSIIYSGGRQKFSQHKSTNVLGHERTITEHKYIKSTTMPGTPDLLGCLPDGTGLAIEIKHSKSDRMSKEQLAYKAAWPGVFVIAKTLDDVWECIKK